ncbi:hypothetical protein GF382_02355 [Candidatus Falkowbacteria bacterium]|nr:hypothetical protein [Candidatus Falkowbacteria bacterium]
MKKYFDGHVSAGFMSIYTSRTIARISMAMMGLFLPIFLYQLFDKNIKVVMIYYIIDRMIYILLLPLGAKYALNKSGIKPAMIWSTAWIIIYYLVFYVANKWLLLGDLPYGLSSGQVVGTFFFLSIFLLNMRRLLYWVPFHTDLAKFTDAKNRVRQLCLLEASMMFLKAIMPVVAGWIIFTFDYNILFVFSIIIYFASAMPLIAMPKTDERFSWGYFKTIKELFSKKRRKMVLANFGDGIEYIINIVIWPIFIFELLNGNYFQIGFLSSVIVVASIMLQFLVGRLGDGGKRDKILRAGIMFYSIGWVVKIFIQTAFQIFVVSTYHNLARIFTRAPFDALYYEKAADEGHFVDEYTVIREMALNFGSAVAFLLVMLIAPSLGMQWTFILGAIAALFMNFLISDGKEKIKNEN